MPDWTTFNGYANQYVTHPLTAKPGDTTRFWVVAAGPTLDTNFHVVGSDPRPRLGLLTASMIPGRSTACRRSVVPAGGGAVFDVKIADEGLYPFVSHAFAHVDLGQVGLLKVGNPHGDDEPLGAQTRDDTPLVVTAPGAAGDRGSRAFRFVRLSGRAAQAHARVRRDGFPRLGRPARVANGRGRSSRRPRRRSSGLVAASGRRPHGRRRPRPRARWTSVEVQGGPPPAERAAGALTGRLPDDVAVVAAKEAPSRVPCAALGPRPLSTGTGSSRARVVAVRARAFALVAAAARRGGARRGGPACSSASTTSPAFTPTETEHEAFTPHGSRGRMGAARRSPRLHP